jgi:hypothetical protein
MCSGPFAYGGPSCSVNVLGAVCPGLSLVEAPDTPGTASLNFFETLKRSLLRCHEYRSSVHRRRYSAFVAGSGRGGKLDLGSRSVGDHDARRIRVGASIIASWAGWWGGGAGLSTHYFLKLELSWAMVRRLAGVNTVLDSNHQNQC